MINRRDTIKLTALFGVGALFPQASADAASGKLAWRAFQADEAGFSRMPVLLSGRKEAILLDGGFTLSDGRKLAEAIKASGKTLTTIYVSCPDPDYYFSLRPVVEAFPAAKVIAKPVTVASIKASVQGKLEVWGPKLGDNGPRSLAEVVIPAPSEAAALDLEGHRIEIVEVPDMHDRRYLWVPSLKAVFGGVLVSSGGHVWLADNADAASRQAWIRALDAIAARKPGIVVPAHHAEGAPEGLAAVKFTRDYIAAFNREADKAKDSAALIEAMKALYPKLGGLDSLDLSAKVVKGEMKWG
ncbi:MBL fold metallo-hydrolase [Labrys sp. WJW]|uniref:MBL fold metallo-hydrolase n=1 Tax=Labrys sp. WJW TaxID=1737983 RepID=UPI0008295A65|nr:MBL fold metallo-hydrolase [Labrys sp. WJW]OCC02559.1 MBL fold metallo-hydrolase [Labrys sp. WJW]